MALKVIAAYMGSAYIKALTRENIFAVSGTESRKWTGLKIIPEMFLT